jgi:hypothetical protein
MARGVVQVVESLPSKFKALSSNSSTERKKEKKFFKGRLGLGLPVSQTKSFMEQKKLEKNAGEEINGNNSRKFTKTVIHEF